MWCLCESSAVRLESCVASSRRRSTLASSSMSSFIESWRTRDARFLRSAIGSDDVPATKASMAGESEEVEATRRR